MAYGQRSNNAYQGKSSYSNGGAQKKEGFTPDPNEVGIAYIKNSDKVGTYFSVIITKEIPEGAKLVIFENKAKNRTDKTPTHVLKLSKEREGSRS